MTIISECAQKSVTGKKNTEVIFNMNLKKEGQKCGIYLISFCVIH